MILKKVFQQFRTIWNWVIQNVVSKRRILSLITLPLYHFWLRVWETATTSRVNYLCCVQPCLASCKQPSPGTVFQFAHLSLLEALAKIRNTMSAMCIYSAAWQSKSRWIQKYLGAGCLGNEDIWRKIFKAFWRLVKNASQKCGQQGNLCGNLLELLETQKVLHIWSQRLNQNWTQASRGYSSVLISVLYSLFRYAK